MSNSQSFIDTLLKFAPLYPERLRSWLKKQQKKRTVQNEQARSKWPRVTTSRRYVVLGMLVALVVFTVGTVNLLSPSETVSDPDTTTQQTTQEVPSSDPDTTTQQTTKEVPSKDQYSFDNLKWPNLESPTTVFTWIGDTSVTLWHITPWYVPVGLVALYLLLRRRGPRTQFGSRAVSTDDSYWQAQHRMQRYKARRGATFLMIVLLGIAALGVFVFAPGNTFLWVAGHWQGWVLLFMAAFALGAGRHMEDTLKMGYIPTYLSIVLAFVLFIGALVKLLG